MEWNQAAIWNRVKLESLKKNLCFKYPKKSSHGRNSSDMNYTSNLKKKMSNSNFQISPFFRASFWIVLCYNH